MRQNIFKYETRSGKKIRVKDLLMLFTIFVLCIMTAVVSGTAVRRKLQANTNVVRNTGDNQNSEYTKSMHHEKSSITAPQKKDDIIPQQEWNFIKPVDGGILKPFSNDELLYSETMDDWRIHSGIDISCNFGTPVLSVENGIVTDISHDINYGNTVTIQSGEYEHIYSSLSSDISVKKGQKINRGDTVGVSSDSCMSEICDDPHIHFEMKKNGVYINPMEIIKFN